MRRAAIVTCAVLALAIGASAPAIAQTPSDSPLTTRVQDHLLKGLYGATFLVQLYDARTTIDAVDAGAREINPLVAPMSTSRPLIVTVAFARAAAIDLAVHSIARRNRVAAIAVGAAINSAYLVIAAHNTSVADGMRAQQNR